MQRLSKGKSAAGKHVLWHGTGHLGVKKLVTFNTEHAWLEWRCTMRCFARHHVGFRFDGPHFLGCNSGEGVRHLTMLMNGVADV
jgi:hypothetical protein